MNAELKSLLISVDEVDALEFPEGFEADDIEKRARGVLGNLLDAGYDATFEDWIYNQDATFGLAILVKSFQKATNHGLAVVTVRFSNFGRLATFTWPDLATPEFSSLLLESLEEFGFQYIPSEELDVPYDGVNPASCFPTWWVRYFDWI